MERNRIGVVPELHENNTFWTQYHICSVNFQYSREHVNRLLRCQNCYRVFEARELESGHLQSFRNQFPNCEEFPKQCLQSQDPPSTFWTQCSFCSVKFEYYRDTLGQLLNCQMCRKAFKADELKRDVLPKLFINQFSNPMEPSEQGPSNLASESDDGSKKGNITNFHFGDAVKKKRNGQFSSAAKKKRKIAAVEMKTKGAAMPDKDEDVSFLGNVDSAYTPKEIEGS